MFITEILTRFLLEYMDHAEPYWGNLRWGGSCSIINVIKLILIVNIIVIIISVYRANVYHRNSHPFPIRVYGPSLENRSLLFWWLALHGVQVKAGCGALSRYFSFKVNLYIQNNRVGNRRIMLGSQYAMRVIVKIPSSKNYKRDHKVSKEK